VQVDPIKSELKAPGTNLLTLQYDEPRSIFAFKFNLRRCNEGRKVRRLLGRDEQDWGSGENQAGGAAEAGAYTC